MTYCPRCNNPIRSGKEEGEIPTKGGKPYHSMCHILQFQEDATKPPKWIGFDKTKMYENAVKFKDVLPK